MAGFGNNGLEVSGSTIYTLEIRAASSEAEGRQLMEGIMSNKIKGLLLGIFLIGAISGSVVAFAGFGRAENELISDEAPGSENRYVLRDYEGYVAIFVENEPTLPMTVTDIQVSTLRELDKQMLVTGMKVDTHEGLVMLLEDLGS